jgi:hypothetical protein
VGNQQRPSPAEIHRWIADLLQLSVDELEATQLSSLEGAAYVKLTTRHLMDNLLITTSGKSLLHRHDGTQTEIILTSAEINIVTVRIFNIPLKINSGKIIETL